MTCNIHIPKFIARAGPILRVVVMLLGLAGAFRASGQSTDPDTVCLGETKSYWTDSVANPGATYTWRIDGAVQQNGPVNLFQWTWSALGDFTVSVRVTSADNCAGPWMNLPVHVFNGPPVFAVPPLATGYCVEDISSAVYNPGGTYYVDDLVPPRPDYYLLMPGETLLDINPTDDCPGVLTITWEIDFPSPPSPDLTGTGQISATMPPGGIRFPVGTSTITWTVTDAGGLSTTHSASFVVLPRPDIGDIPP